MLFELSSYSEMFSANIIRIAVTAVVILIYVIMDRLGTPKIEESVDQGHFQDNAAVKAIRLTRLIYGIVGGLVLLLVWGVDIKSILIFASTLITILGVALFASWSLLSNITAHFILLVNPAFKRGTFIRVVEGDNYAEGYISELLLFNTKLVTENREVILIPNNLLLGRAVLINPRKRLDGVGKLPPLPVLPIPEPDTSK